MKRRLKVLMFASAVFALAGCATPGFKPQMKLADAKLNPETVTEHTLKWLPGPTARIPIAVYGVADQTGSFKPSEGGQTLSRAVTQAPTPILIKALQDAGNRRWFSVIERENLQNILRERQIILDMRQRYLGETELNREALPALKFAGVLIEGAITGYDTNTVTGGAGARYLGIGGSTQYREDAVSVYLRAVSVKTGEVLISISSEQRVASIAASGNAFKFVAFQELLEAEAGLTLNQPRHLAVRQAFEKAVYGMIVEGAELGLWQFGDDFAGQAAIAHYRSTYASAPKEMYKGVLPDAFYAARQRDVQRIQTAANVSRQEVAALNTPQPRRVASAGPLASVDIAQAQAVPQRQATRRPQPQRSQRVAPTAVAAPVQRSAPQERQQVAVQQSVRRQPAEQAEQQRPEVIKARSVRTHEPKVSQTVLDAIEAVARSGEGDEGGPPHQSRTLTADALQNLLLAQNAARQERSSLSLARLPEEELSDVGTQQRGAAPPPP